MPVTTEITLDMCLNEVTRVYQVMKKHYPKMVKAQKMNPYQRDHRLAVMKKMVSLLQQAKENKQQNIKPSFIDLLNQLP